MTTTTSQAYCFELPGTKYILRIIDIFHAGAAEEAVYCRGGRSTTTYNCAAALCRNKLPKNVRAVTVISRGQCEAQGLLSASSLADILSHNAANVLVITRTGVRLPSRPPARPLLDTLVDAPLVAHCMTFS